MGRLIQSIPTIEQIQDSELRRILTSVRSNIESWAGVSGSEDDNLLNVQDFIDLGILARDTKNRLFFTGSTTQQTTVVADGTANATVAQQGWLTGKLDLTGANAGDTVFLPLTIPPFARIQKTWYEVLTGFTAGSGAPDIGISLQYDSVPSYTQLVTSSLLGTGWTLGVHDGIQDYTAVNTSDKTDDYYSIQADIGGTGDISAGVFRIFVHYFIVS